MVRFFWSRTASVWIAILYMALGLPLLLFPGVIGTVFVWMLSGGAGLYAVSHLWRYLQRRKEGRASGGDLFLTVLPLAFSLFALFCPQVILAFLPLVLGGLLLVDGVGKGPVAIEAIRAKSPGMLPAGMSALVPIVLGVLLLVNPFQTARMVIIVFGAALIADGVSDLAVALSRRSRPPASGRGI